MYARHSNDLIGGPSLQEPLRGSQIFWPHGERVDEAAQAVSPSRRNGGGGSASDGAPEARRGIDRLPFFGGTGRKAVIDNAAQQKSTGGSCGRVIYRCFHYAYGDSLCD